MSRKLIAALTALAAFAAFAVSATSASAVELTEPTGTKLANGATLTGTNVGETIMTNLAGEPLIRCSKVDMHGTLTTNGPTTITGDITSAVFSGTGTGEDCTSSLGTSVRVTTAVAGGLPYCLKTIAETDKFEVRGGLCTEAARSIKYTLDFTSGGTCGYEKANLTGTFTTDTPTTQDAILTTTKEGNFKRYEAEGGFSAFLCPSEAQLDMSFTLETTNGSPIYVS